MMNKFRKIIAVAMAAVVVIAGSSVMQVQTGSKTIGLNINCSKLMKGDSFKLRVEYNETAQKLSEVKWSTDDAKVAKISKECKVTATGAGITCVHGKFRARSDLCYNTGRGYTIESGQARAGG